MPQSGVAEARGDRSQHDARRASRDAARAALLEWDAREQERLPSAVRALDDWSSSEHEAVDRMDWSTAPEPPAPAAHDASDQDAVAPATWTPSGGVPGRRTVTIRARWATATPRPGRRARAAARSAGTSAPASVRIAPPSGRSCSA